MTCDFTLSGIDGKTRIGMLGRTGGYCHMCSIEKEEYHTPPGVNPNVGLFESVSCFKSFSNYDMGTVTGVFKLLQALFSEYSNRVLRRESAGGVEKISLRRW